MAVEPRPDDGHHDPVGVRLDLLDYRRRVAALYARLRDGWSTAGAPTLHAKFWQAREALFREHPQSPVAETARNGFRLRYYSYRPEYRQLVRPEVDAASPCIEVRLAADGAVRLRRFAHVMVRLNGHRCRLALYWLEGYGGGLFLPFRDATNGVSSYGGGRYLLDTVKHADLGADGESLILDFNFAYHPSCAYHPRWDCPLAPPENRLQVAVEAGEMAPEPAAADPRSVET